jgi:ABC-type uncharacterized transport system ATPase subunit
VRVLGFVPSREPRQLAFQIGPVVGQRSQLWYQLPPRDTFDLQGVTLLLTSHDTGDMERVCTREIVINHGPLLRDGPIASLRRAYLKRQRVTLWSDTEHLKVSLPGVRVLSSGSYRTELEVAIDTTPLAGRRHRVTQSAIRDMIAFQIHVGTEDGQDYPDDQ